MAPEQQAYLRNLCRILGIPEAFTDAHPELALNVLARMYLVPTIESHADRNPVLNEIRGNLAGYEGSMGEFIDHTAQLAAMMQELPGWYDHLNASTEVLVAQYKSLDYAVFVVGSLGIGATGTAFAAGAVELSRSGSVRAGAVRTGERLLGRGPVLEEIERRMSTRIPLGRVGAIGAVVAIGGTLAYHNALEQMEEIRAVLLDRFQRGDMTDDQFRDVFGSHISPDDVQRYWEM